MSGVLIIMLISGVFQAGIKGTRSLLENELEHISQDVYQDFGNISVHGVDLAQRLSKSLEKQFAEHGFTADQLQQYPELLEGFLEKELSQLTNALEKIRSSGAFLILDATVNTELEDAEYSRAGLYIKNMEPNIVSSTFSHLRFMRGPAAIARNSGLYVLPQWKMEFQVKDMECYWKTIKTAKNHELPLSRLYYWSRSMTLADNSEAIMLCCIPLIDSNGHVFGICGFEVSSMLFKLSYSPDNSTYKHIFCMFSPEEDAQLNTEGSLFAGSYAAYLSNMSAAPLSVSPGKHSLYSYMQTDSASYTGLHKSISLYPKDSAYADEKWTLALMMPEQELSARLSSNNTMLFFMLFLLMVVSVSLSAVLSRKYIKPVVEGLNLLKTSQLSSVTKTGIPEIDDLIEFLTAQDGISTHRVYEAKNVAAPVLSRFNQFMENISTLSRAERAVFDLYIQGHTAKEIAEILCLSINTIKTHNKRIYMKLNVTSRKELMLYIQMMEEVKIQNVKK